MPELPEVETVVRGLSGRLVSQTIEKFETYWPRQALPDARTLVRELRGRDILGLSRRGKKIVMALSGARWLLVHLRMSGRFEWAQPGEELLAHTRAVWHLASGDRLQFVDARKFGRIEFTDDLANATKTMGMEPLSRAFSVKRFRALLSVRSRAIKPLLLDQSVIAGLGNIYVTEALYAAGVHPLRASDSLTDAETERLHRAIRQALNDGIRHNGASIDWIYPGGRMQDYLRVYGRQGQACARCGRTLERLIVGQRASVVCPVCQPL